HFVAAEAVEVDIELVDIERQVGRRLRAIAHDQCAHAARNGGDIADGIDRAERVGDMAECNDFRSTVHQRRKLVEIHTAVRGYGADAELSPTLDGELLPRDEVGVMFEARDDELVASD